MRHPLLIGYLLVGCCSGGSPSTRAPSEPEREADTVTGVSGPGYLALVVTQEADLGGAPAVRLALQNNSEQLLWVNHNLNIGGEGWPRTNVWLDITDDEGVKHEASCRISYGAPLGPDYIVLTTRAEFSAVKRLLCFQLKPGRYTIVAHYRDSRRRPERPPAGTFWFSGEIVSQPATVVVRLGPRYPSQSQIDD